MESSVLVLGATKRNEEEVVLIRRSAWAGQSRENSEGNKSVRNSGVRAAVVVTALGALVLAGCASKGKKDNTTPPPAGGSSGASTPSSAPTQALKPVLPAGDGKGKCSSGVQLAYIGTINGGNAALGIAEKNAMQLAIDQHNAANPGCQVGMKSYDSEGTPDKAPGVVTQAINTKSIIGVMGLPFSGESKATGAALEQAGLVHITASATNPGLTTNGWKTFFRGLGNDASQGPAAAKFITGQLGAKSVCVIKDDSDYGIGLAKTVSATLGSAQTCTDDVKTGQKDFSATIGKINQAKPDAVFYSGYYQEGGPFWQQLKQAGYAGKFVAPDGVKDPNFIKLAGQSVAEGVYFTCPCVPATASATFAQQYQAKFGQPPQTYSAEAYDATTVLLQGIDHGAKTRADELAYVKGYSADGITKHMQWGPNGELAGTITIWSYIVKGGQIVQLNAI